MSGRKQPAVRTSLYRLVGIRSLEDCFQPKYVSKDSFQLTATSVGDREALILHGTIAPPEVKWTASIEQLTAIKLTDLENKTAAAVLVIRQDENIAWALAYGMGFHALDQGKIDPGFGQKVAIRTVTPTELQSLTRTVLDQRARTDRLSIPGGDGLSGFGVGDFGELISRLAAKGKIEGLTGSRTKPITIRGSDALSVPLGRAPADLLSDLAKLEALLDAPAKPELEALEQLVALKPSSHLVPELEQALEDALASAPRSELLGLGWPHERNDESGTASAYRIEKLGARIVSDGLSTLDDLLGRLDNEHPESRVEALRGAKITLYRDAEGDEPVSSAISAFKWLTFETNFESRRYCLNDGRWFLVNEDYAQRLRARVESILSKDPGIVLPDWTSNYADEAEYNVAAAQALDGVLIDRKLIYTVAHPKGIEPCDVLTPDGKYVHIKSVENSKPISHLVAQALVSAESLTYDSEALTEFRTRVSNAGGDPDAVPPRPEHVVLAIAQPRPLSVDTLFTFAQVVIARQVESLEGRGVHVRVVGIKRGDA